MDLTDVDYKLIIKNCNFNSDSPDLSIINRLISNHGNHINDVGYKSIYYFPYKLVKSFDELYPNKEIPSELKEIFLNRDPESILKYCIYKLDKRKQKPEDWVYDGLFKLLERVSYKGWKKEEWVSGLIAEIIEWYLIDHDFNDLDPRIFDYLINNHEVYPILNNISKKDIKNFNTKNFKIFFEVPIKKFNTMQFYVFFKNVLYAKYKNKKDANIYNLLDKIGVLDIYLKHTIDKDIDKKLREDILSYGGTEEEMPEVYRKREEEDRIKRQKGKTYKESFKLYFQKQ
jgi:hypothetical protein